MIEEQELTREAADVILMRDTFDQDRRAGTVIGSQATDGTTRLGCDVEGIIGIDNSALRIQSLLHAGWGRAGIAYGPYRRENGLAFAVFMLNGHNASQLDFFEDPLKRRLGRWALGSMPKNEGKAVLAKRMARWMLSPNHTSRVVRRLHWWYVLRRDSEKQLRFDENLAVGWFPEQVPGTELPAGNILVMHALGAQNGDLWAVGGKTPLPAVHSVQNIQFYLVVVLRERGAAYYAASLPNANELTAFPSLRPLAVEPFRDDPEVYAGVHQGVLGQIGFRSETRVYGATVSKLGQFSSWYGSAHAADLLTGAGDLAGSAAEAGGNWQVTGRFERAGGGSCAMAGENVALLYPEVPSGLVHTVLQWDSAGSAGLVWRAADSRNYWLLRLGEGESRLEIVQDGVFEQIAAGVLPALSDGAAHSLQILDDGSTLTATLDGALLFERRFIDMRLASARGVGIWANAKAARFSSFEAHPRAIEAPTALDLGALWLQQGQQLIVSETFDGEPRLLEGKQTTTGGKTWARALGRGFIDVLGNGTAKVRATAAEPAPGRTAFTVEWDHPHFADLALDMTPPPGKYDEDEKGRCGVIFWQDADNFIIVSTYLEGYFHSASVSSFFHLKGVEEIYDAVWTNLPRHITWGTPFRLRVVFDGVNYLAFVNDEPVLYRALTDIYPNHKRLTINRVGLLANWEWGSDTGTILKQFTAKV